jgi:hypothetical protein
MNRRLIFERNIRSEKSSGLAFVYLACALLLVGNRATRADRGAIVALGDVNIEEPAQRAVIAHDGVREILILQTDVKADRKTKIVEFMPLPSKPDVSLAPEGCFSALQEIIKAHKLQYVIHYRGKNKSDTEAKAEAVTLVLSEQLGPHKVSVVEVKDANEFVRWVESFFAENDLGKPILGDELRTTVAQYLHQGIRFFAFDIVAVSAEKKTVRPLVYSFKSSKLYYPLKVTNLYGGSGTVELLTILPRDLRERGLWISASWEIREKKPMTYTWFKRSTSAELSVAEMERIEPSIARLMEKEPGILRAYKYEGPLTFDADVNVYLGYGSVKALSRQFFKTLERGDLEKVITLAAVPFAFDRKKVIKDEKELRENLRKLLHNTRGKAFNINGLDCIIAKEYPLGDGFDKSFVGEYLEGTVDYIIAVRIKDEKVILFASQIKYGNYKIVGFSD